MFFSSYVGVKGKVISVEASPDNFKIYLHRIKTIWNLTNVLPLNFILGKSDSELVSLRKPDFFDDGIGFYFRIENTVSANYSYTRRVDTLLSPIKIDKVKMIKIDVEGAELGVLSGASDLLKQTEFVLVEVSSVGGERFGTSVKELYDLLFQSDFTFSYSISQDSKGNSFLTEVSNTTGNVLFSKNKISL